jgi:hypothetical protein
MIKEIFQYVFFLSLQAGTSLFAALIISFAFKWNADQTIMAAYGLWFVKDWEGLS